MRNYKLKLFKLLKVMFIEEKRKADKEFISMIVEVVEDYLRIESRPTELKRIVFRKYNREITEMIRLELSKLFAENEFKLGTQEYGIYPDCPCIDWKTKQ